MKKLKKLTSVFLAVIMALGVLTVAPFTVSAATYGDYEYTLEDDFTCTITKYNGSASNVTIPSMIYGNKVATIGKTAFYKNNNLERVKIPNGITKINGAAFADCEKLKIIELPTYMEEIEGSAFAGTSIESMNLPSGITYIGSMLFSKCVNLKSVKIPNTVIALYQGCFYSCTSLENICLPDSVEYFNEPNIFKLCSNLKNVEIGSGLRPKWYYENSFSSIFDGCLSLQSFKVSDKNSYYYSDNGVLFTKDKQTLLMFPPSKQVTSYSIPNTVKKTESFYNKYLKTLTIPESVNSIENSIGFIPYSEKMPGFTIKGYKGTEAEKYARNNDFNFVALPKPVNPTSVSLNTSSVILGAGESATLTATLQPSNAVKTLTWSSSNTSVATVSNGKVTAKKSGTAYITVKTSNGKTAQCKVTVKPAPTSVKTNPTNITLGVGEKYTISENTNSGSYANAANLKWSTSNSGVATVAKGSANKATITAKGVGTAYIKITLYNGKTAQCKVTVKPAPTSVKTNPASVTLGKSETYTISESTNSGSYANAANLKWSTSNSSVATVTKGSANKATIKATGIGTAYIRITLYNGKTAQCKVTVKNAPSSVSLSKTSITLNKGASYTISESTNSGSYANAANLKWTSSNSSVATVTKSSGNKAVIKAKAKGTSYIKITLYNGKTAQCKVTVK